MAVEQSSGQPIVCVMKKDILFYNSVISDFKPKKMKVYKIPKALQPEVDKRIDEILKLGLMLLSNSLMASPMVCVMKNDKFVRITVNYRCVNSYYIADTFPVPNVEEIKLNAGISKYITVTDVKYMYR